MIGRLGWLAAGVVLGVTGYRRASRLARSVRPAGIAARWSWPASGPDAPAARLSPSGRAPPAAAASAGWDRSRATCGTAWSSTWIVIPGRRAITSKAVTSMDTK